MITTDCARTRSDKGNVEPDTQRMLRLNLSESYSEARQGDERQRPEDEFVAALDLPQAAIKARDETHSIQLAEARKRDSLISNTDLHLFRRVFGGLVGLRRRHDRRSGRLHGGLQRASQQPRHQSAHQRQRDE